MRRKVLGVSQEELAAVLGITFQQVQKYERGANRVSASKLYETARTLKAPISFFFEGLPEGGDREADATPDAIITFLGTPEGLQLAVLFPQIKNKRLRRSILEFAIEAARNG